MLPTTLFEVLFVFATLSGCEARRAFTHWDPNWNTENHLPLEQRDARNFLPPVVVDQRNARKAFTGWENQHRKPFTAPPQVTDRPVIAEDHAFPRPVIVATTMSTEVRKDR